MQEPSSCGFRVWTTRPDLGLQTSTVMLLPNRLLSLRAVTRLPALQRETWLHLFYILWCVMS